MAAAHAYAARLARAPLRVREVLERADAADFETVARLVRGSEVAAEVWASLAGGDIEPTDLEHFDELRELAVKAATRKIQGQLGRKDHEYDVYRWRDNNEGKRKREEEFFDCGGIRQGMPDKPPGKGGKRGTPRSRLRATGSTVADNRLASAKDGEQRKHYVDEIVGDLIKLQCPTAAAAAHTSDPRGTLSLVAAGRRASTLRARLRAWRAFGRWLWAAYGERWPSTWHRLVDYLRARAEEPCGRQTLLSIAHAAAFWEKATGWQLTADPLWEPAIKELLSRVGGRAGGISSSSAPPLLVSHLAMLESIVTDTLEDGWLRCYAGWKCAKVWAAFRFSDHRGINPARMEVTEDCVQFVLEQTKTTGREKKVQIRVAAISSGAYVLEEAWLTTWTRMMREEIPHVRDYLMAPPGMAPHTAAKKELSYAEAAGWSRALLKRFGLAVGMTAQSAEWMAHHYTEHSERGCLPTIGMAMGLTEDYLKPLGGWGATSAQRHMKAAIARMIAIQDEVALRLRKQWGRVDQHGEGHQIAALARHLREQGLPKGQAEQQAALNRITMGASTPMEQGTRDDHDEHAEPKAATGAAHGIQVGTAARGASSSGIHDTTNPAPVTTQTDLRHLDALPESERGYVISVSSKTGYRRLHYLGACCRVPGVHYVQYELYGRETPKEGDYDDHCRQCWPPRAAAGSKKTTVSAEATKCELGDPEESEDSQDHSSSSEADR